MNLIELITRNNIRDLKYALDNGYDPNMKDDWHKYCCVRPLSFAIQVGNIEVVKLLIEKGADILFGFDLEEHDFSSAMASAIMAKNDEIIQLLFDHGHPPTKHGVIFAMKCDIIKPLSHSRC